jgi:hypothetical protein
MASKRPTLADDADDQNTSLRCGRQLPVWAMKALCGAQLATLVRLQRSCDDELAKFVDCLIARSVT